MMIFGSKKSSIKRLVTALVALIVFSIPQNGLACGSYCTYGSAYNTMGSSGYGLVGNIYEIEININLSTPSSSGSSCSFSILCDASFANPYAGYGSMYGDPMLMGFGMDPYSMNPYMASPYSNNMGFPSVMSPYPSISSTNPFIPMMPPMYPTTPTLYYPPIVTSTPTYPVTYPNFYPTVPSTTPYYPPTVSYPPVTIPSPPTTPLPWGGCDNVIVMCPTGPVSPPPVISPTPFTPPPTFTPVPTPGITPVPTTPPQPTFTTGGNTPIRIDVPRGMHGF